MKISFSENFLLLSIYSVSVSILALERGLTIALILLSPIGVIVNNDFKAFLSLGPGGTPSTFAGYMKICILRLFTVKAPCSPSPSLYSTALNPQKGLLSYLPARPGPRPSVAGLAPQRQLNQWAPPHIDTLLRSAIKCAALNTTHLLETTASFGETGLALHARGTLLNPGRDREACHIHDTDKSLHLALHPDDAKIVLEGGWGERHPLARGGWMCRFVPMEFVMIYAPRDVDEVCSFNIHRSSARLTLGNSW